MTINDEILVIANQLANKGQKPTVALIKTRLSQPVPLPKIISVLKSWQHQPEFTQVKKSEEHSSPSLKKTEIEITQAIEQAVNQAVKQAITPLKTEISELKALIRQLIDQ